MEGMAGCSVVSLGWTSEDEFPPQGRSQCYLPIYVSLFLNIPDLSNIGEKSTELVPLKG